jgi:hypothetical protein
MFIAAVVGQKYSPMLGKVLSADDFEDALTKALGLLAELGIYKPTEGEGEDTVIEELTENHSYTAKGYTVAIGEVEES